MPKDHEQLPIFKKAQEILELTHAIAEALDAEEDELQLREQMLANAMIIPARIAGAHGADLYSLQMEKAVQIKLAACELKTQTNLLLMEDIDFDSYCELLRDEIDHFKPLFIEWINTFDPMNDANDGWIYITPPREEDME